MLNYSFPYFLFPRGRQPPGYYWQAATEEQGDLAENVHTRNQPRRYRIPYPTIVSGDGDRR